MQRVVNLGGSQWEKGVKCDLECPIYNILIVCVCSYLEKKRKMRRQKSKSCAVLLLLV